jgi:hypothetical protein
MDHRALGVELYNGCWTLMERDRTADEDALLIHQAHASLWHWSQVGAPENIARGEWLCARVYATLGRSEPALWHARRCIQLASPIGDWDLAAGFEELARAHAVAGDALSAREALEASRAVPVADPDDRAVIEKDCLEVEALL